MHEIPAQSKLFLGHHKHLQGSAFSTGFLFDLAHVFQILDDPFQDFNATILMDDFTASEEHGHLAAIAILEERADVLEFRPSWDAP